MSDNTSKNLGRTYFLRTTSMYMDLTKDTLLQLFQHLNNNENIITFLTTKNTKVKLQDLFQNGVLNKNEYTLVSSCWPNPEKFDIALLIRLILGLFRGRISGPQLGWYTKPQHHDVSLGADLLRLRNTKNELIGHRESENLDEAEYIHIFNKTEAILIRILAAFDREEAGNLKKKLNEYKDLHFGYVNGKIRRYLSELAEADNETKRLQTQVEELMKKSKEFQTFFKTTPERFVRYVKLLFDGGGTALRGILERELRKADKSLDSLLSENKEMLLQTMQEEYYQFLFPQESSQKDHNCWEVGLLASVILLIFTDLSMDEINNIEEIQTARQNYAMHAISCLDADEFLIIWTDLISSLKYLSMGIEEEKKHHIENLIDRYKKKCNEGDADDYLDQLRQTGAPVKTLKCIYDEYMYQLKQRLRQLKERALQFKCDHVLELKIMVSCEDETKKRNAEDELDQKLRASLLESHHGYDFLQMEADLFMSSITSHPNINLTGVTRCCIMVSFTCSTLDGVMNLLNYSSSQDFLKRICYISNELSYLYEDAFLVQGYITLESLSEIEISDSQKHVYEEGISLPLKCSSAEGMEHILDTLQNVKTANTLNSIADKLSEQLEETVYIHVTTNLIEFRGVFTGAQNMKNKIKKKGLNSLTATPTRPNNTGPPERSTNRHQTKTTKDTKDQVLRSKSRSVIPVSKQEEGDVMENVTDKPVNEIESDCKKKCGRRQRKKGNRSNQKDPKLLSPLQEFVTFKRHIMPKLVSEDEDYQRKKQELKDFLITTHRKTLKEKGFNKRISMIFGRGRLMSPKTGIVTSYRGIFYDDYQRKQHKYIHIIGEEGRASTVCLELVSAWCDAQSEGNVHILKNFEFVFMISLSDVGSGDSINEMIRLHLQSEEYIGTLDQVLQLEPDKCLIILDGLDKWRHNTYNKYSALEIPKGNLFSDYVILVTASRHLKNRIKREFGDKQLLYIC
ncbi:uncharacterized protein LOC132749965 isoform X2 [Ruditapes philippinarum]|uniref:uncharacterized protein LOC132749965 isoform X2 n=1 Tax=Ruditapes philippinarum TaxID=129788 RepID=UPI00295BAE71|nr:uncharacterized protein LOC132749965 isoform X2 [Ruditapes philippinarum]